MEPEIVEMFQIFLHFSFLGRKRPKVPIFKMISKRQLIIVYCNDINFVPISNLLAPEKYSYLYQ